MNNQNNMGQNSVSGMSMVANNQMNRTKMNSTMMVKFNSSTEKQIDAQGVRSNLNKSTLLPSNFVSTKIHSSQMDNLVGS
jgi:hypothetical protein